MKINTSSVMLILEDFMKKRVRPNVAKRDTSIYVQLRQGPTLPVRYVLSHYQRLLIARGVRPRLIRSAGASSKFPA